MLAYSSTMLRKYGYHSTSRLQEIQPLSGSGGTSSHDFNRFFRFNGGDFSGLSSFGTSPRQRNSTGVTGVTFKLALNYEGWTWDVPAKLSLQEQENAVYINNIYIICIYKKCVYIYKYIYIYIYIMYIYIYSNPQPTTAATFCWTQVWLCCSRISPTDIHGLDTLNILNHDLYCGGVFRYLEIRPIPSLIPPNLVGGFNPSEKLL